MSSYTGTAASRAFEAASGEVPTTRVELLRNAGVARIRLDGALTRNALDIDSAAALVDACAVIDADDTIGVAVVEGLHGAFCSGAARHILAGLASANAAVAYERLTVLYGAFARVHALQVPTLAVVDGPAVGAGLNLALVADVRVATPQARFISGFAPIGIHPGGGHLHLLERAAGRQTAAAMGLFGQPLDAQGAQASGLVWRTVDRDEMPETVENLVRSHASDPELARALKSSLNHTTGRGDWIAATEVERARQMWSLARHSTSTTS
jgi:enoyl-CoA hydratase